MKRLFQTLPSLAVLLLVLTPGQAKAHCDTLSGPVVSTARTALEKGDVTPVLKWVRKEDEKEIRDLFSKTLTARGKGKEARELADQYFFETLVRIHRAGEGEPYPGLKPAGQVEPSVAAADKAIESGSPDSLIRMLNDAAAAGVRQRYAAVQETRKHSDESVEAGRKYVQAYVDFTHYVESLGVAAGSAAHHEEARHGHEQYEHHQGH